MNTLQKTGLMSNTDIAFVLEQKLACCMPYNFQVERMNDIEFKNSVDKVFQRIGSILWLLEETELNDYYDSSRSCNGGGYHQPSYSFEHGNVKLSYDDTSCGDFGSRLDITLTTSHGVFTYFLDSVNNYQEYAELKYDNNTYCYNYEEEKLYKHAD